MFVFVSQIEEKNCKNNAKMENLNVTFFLNIYACPRIPASNFPLGEYQKKKFYLKC